jgi:hypothetical protein
MSRRDRSSIRIFCSAAIASIDLDIARTWPRHRSMDDEARAALRRVLVALALTEPEVGYCQGLNEVAATLLLLAASEAEAFGMLVHLLRVALPRDWYGETLGGSIAEGRVLALLLDAGGDINAASDNGTTPLMMAASEGRIDAVALLLQRGADPGRTTDAGRTASAWARASGHARIAETIEAAEKKK